MHCTSCEHRSVEPHQGRKSTQRRWKVKKEKEQLVETMRVRNEKERKEGERAAVMRFSFSEPTGAASVLFEEPNRPLAEAVGRNITGQQQGSPLLLYLSDAT